ncbi:MAG: DUF4373 domain-containing protein [Bacteroidales bacterium]|nr:DUF4373 domain-containing protein [Bacteroidales bacterium]
MKKSTFCETMYAKSSHLLTKLRMQKGCTGLGIYMCLLEALFDESTAMLPKEYDVIAFRFGLSEDDVRDVVENYGLFEFTDGNDSAMFYCELLRAERMPKPKKNRPCAIPQPSQPETVVAEIIKPATFDQAITTIRSDIEWQKHTADIFNITDVDDVMLYFDEYLGVCEEKGYSSCDIVDLKNGFTMWLSPRLRLNWNQT